MPLQTIHFLVPHSHTNKMQKKIVKVGIIGGAGYTAGELLRVLLSHPYVEIVFVQSESHAGADLWQVHQDLLGESSLCFVLSADVHTVDCLFLCSGHHKGRSFMETLPTDYAGVVIDLSQDFRLKDTCEDFVYALPEAFGKDIKGAKRLANPGCFATAIQLALLPLAFADQLSEVHITGITGSTGAGQKPIDSTHFSWRSDNLSAYKVFTHQHLLEVGETLHLLAPSFADDINFVPLRGDFARGIFISAYMNCTLSEEALQTLYTNFYKDAPFVVVSPINPDLKMVVNTNKAVIYVRKHGKKVHIISIIDNLLKGASGQAVQNMNIAFDLPETVGLLLKANRF